MGPAKSKHRHSNLAFSDQESLKNAAESDSETHLGIASLGQRLGVLDNRNDMDSLVAYKKRGGARSPAAAQKRASADDGVGIVSENKQPFSDMIAAFPATWQVKKDFSAMCQCIIQQVCAFGNKHKWSELSSEYIQAHVIRKLVLLAASVLEIDDNTWAKCNMADLRSIGAPSHWGWQCYKKMAPEVPASMHCWWVGLAKYATTKSANGQEAFTDAVVAFIEAACAEATQDATRTVFEGARCRLAELRGGMQPTPLMIFRELERTGSLVVGGAPSPAAQAAAVTAAATAAVGPEGVAATPFKKLRRRISSKSQSSAEVRLPFTPGRGLASSPPKSETQCKPRPKRNRAMASIQPCPSRPSLEPPSRRSISRTWRLRK